MGIRKLSVLAILCCLADQLVIRPKAAYAGDEHVRIYIHPDLLQDEPLTSWESRTTGILSSAEELLCDECRKAHLAEGTAATDCKIKLVKATGGVQTFPIEMVFRDSPKAIVDWRSLAVLFSRGVRTTERTIYLVRQLRYCSTAPAPGVHLAGCTNLLFGRISVIAVGGGQRGPGWTRRQAEIWLHELGHGAGAEDRTDSHETKYLMYSGPLQPTGTLLTVPECNGFEKIF